MRSTGQTVRLPTFLIMGAPRSGTTSLARYLGAHPHVFMAPTKEVHYFDSMPDRGVSWYAEHFDGVVDETAIGEATPNYLSAAGAPERIAALLPDVRAIAILRNPVDRAYSAFQHGRSIGRETRSFRNALGDELDGRRAMDPAGRDLPPYIWEGRYGEQLEHLASLLPRDRIHVELFDDLERDPRATHQRVCSFLGVAVEPVPPIVGRVVNGHQGFRSLALRRLLKRLPDGRGWRAAGRALGAFNRRSAAYEPIEDGDRTLLLDLYRDDIATLETWLGRDLLSWRT